VPNPESNPRPLSAFTLVEMLVVAGIISILLALLAPAFTSLNNAGNITDAAYSIKGLLEEARVTAMANDTYVWVGFYEENTSASAPTNTQPPYPGKGRLVMASVLSLDGTAIFDDAATGAALPADRIKQVGKLLHIDGVHITEVGPPAAPSPVPGPLQGKFDGRPDTPYIEGAPYDHYDRISSDDPYGKQSHGDQTKFPFSAQNYTFYKTVRFGPGGEANINGTYSLKHLAELGLVQTHGDQAPTPPPPGATYSGNAIAIQFSGVGGNFTIYTR
jgi:type II secretory pathway pseudopilin PulG